MTCEQALEMLLEADPGELDGVGGSPFVLHLRECAKCRAVALQLAADTRALARTAGETSVVAAPPGVRRRFAPRPVLVAGALAAALALIVLRAKPADEAHRAPAASSPATIATSIVPPVPAAPVVPQPQGTPVAPRRFAEPVAATPVQLTASQSAAVPASAIDDPGVVTVTAPEGTRVAVLRTANPAITVVWLY